MVMSHDPF